MCNSMVPEMQRFYSRAIVITSITPIEIPISDLKQASVNHNHHFRSVPVSLHEFTIRGCTCGLNLLSVSLRLYNGTLP
jgi:hypothetical protein